MRLSVQERLGWPWSFVVGAAITFGGNLLVLELWVGESWLQGLFEAAFVTLVCGLIMWFMTNPAYRRDSVIAGWYADPWEPTRWRWWDGHRWTEHSSLATGTR
jgi:hypothetical protein